MTGMNNYNVFLLIVLLTVLLFHLSLNLSDSTLTVDNVLEVMGKVQKWYWVGYDLQVPSSKRDEIEEQSSTETEKSHQVGRYWVNTHPDPSWEELGKALYRNGEETAAMMVKQYLPPQGM